MIASLSGRLKHRDAGRVVIETGGVGYEVSIPLATYYRLPSLGAPVSLEIRQVVREDSLTDMLGDSVALIHTVPSFSSGKNSVPSCDASSKLTTSAATAETTTVLR